MAERRQGAPVKSESGIVAPGKVRTKGNKGLVIGEHPLSRIVGIAPHKRTRSSLGIFYFAREDRGGLQNVAAVGRGTFADLAQAIGPGFLREGPYSELPVMPCVMHRQSK